MIFERDRLEAGRKRYSLQNATVFREEDHPRADDGKFGKGGGGGKPSVEEATKNFTEARKQLKEARDRGANDSEFVLKLQKAADSLREANQLNDKKKEPVKKEETPTGEYKKAGSKVSGLDVEGKVSNLSSIAASLGEYTILKGIREVPLSDFPSAGEGYKNLKEQQRVAALAEEIKKSGVISPLIVVVDSKGPYVLEGAHRLAALHSLGIKSLPALMVIDEDDPPAEKIEKSNSSPIRVYRASR